MLFCFNLDLGSAHLTTYYLFLAKTMDDSFNNCQAPSVHSARWTTKAKVLNIVWKVGIFIDC